MYQQNEVNVFLRLGTTVTICSLSLLVWLAVAKVDVVAQTSGKIIPQGKNQVISVLETSALEQILVKEGQEVKKEQQIALLDNTNTKANYEQIKNDLSLSKLRLRAINSQLINQSFNVKEGEDLNQFNQVQSEMMSEKLSYENNSMVIQSEMMQVKNEINTNKFNIDKLEKSKSSWQNQSQSYTKLKENGFASSLMAEEKIREAQEKIDEIQIQKKLNEVNEEKFQQSKFKLAASKMEYQQKLLKEKTELIRKINSLEQELIKSEHNINIRILTSPIDGYIKEISVNTPKAVINEGNTLMTIVPKNDVLKADVLLKNTDIGFIEKGQSVKLKVETYAFQKYGLISGKIESISPDAIEDKETKQNLYHVLISIDQNYLEKDNVKYYIKPGMTVNADIITSRRTIIEYLTSSVKKTALETAHER